MYPLVDHDANFVSPKHSQPVRKRSGTAGHTGHYSHHSHHSGSMTPHTHGAFGFHAQQNQPSALCENVIIDPQGFASPKYHQHQHEYDQQQIGVQVQVQMHRKNSHSYNSLAHSHHPIPPPNPHQRSVPHGHVIMGRNHSNSWSRSSMHRYVGHKHSDSGSPKQLPASIIDDFIVPPIHLTSVQNVSYYIERTGHTPPSTTSSNSQSRSQYMPDYPQKVSGKKEKQKRKAVFMPVGIKKKSSHHKLLSFGRKYNKSKSTKKFLTKRIAQELLFEKLDEAMISKFVDEMYKVKVPSQEIIINANDAADAYFVIEKGKLEVYDNGIFKDELDRGDTFGDNALLFATTHQYTYRAARTSDNQRNKKKSACTCWALSQETFNKIRRQEATSRLGKMSKAIKFLKTIEIFKHLDAPDLQVVHNAMIPISFKKNDDIVCQGDTSTHFYIIYKGRCDAIIHYEEDENKKDTKNAMKAGDFFGELGIMESQPRAATVRVTSSGAVVYALTALDFKGLLDYDAFKAGMNKKIKKYAIKLKEAKLFENKVNVKLADLIKNEIGCLGVGAFGRVTLVENPSDKQVFALKKVRKNQVVETSQQEHILNEKKIMAALDSAFCIKLFATFKDELNVYFLLEPVMGGELFSLLRHTKTFKQFTAAFYCGCVVLAFEYLHNELNVIYRDLKPENLMIGANGYCKLVDFGFAKKRNNTCTLCGTPQYLAPEVIRNYSHGFAVDWWTLGILLYEMIFGYPPFEACKNMKMYEKILTAPVEFPENGTKLKPATKNIINSLLRKESHKRLGSGTKGALKIKNHDFFRKLDWDRLSKQQIDSPWKPTIKSSHDLSAFDRFPNIDQEDEKLMDDFDGSIFAWCNEF